MFGLNLNLSILLGAILAVVLCFGVQEVRLKYYQNHYDRCERQIKAQNLSIEQMKVRADIAERLKKSEELNINKYLKIDSVEASHMMNEKLSNDCNATKVWLINKAKGTR